MCLDRKAIFDTMHFRMLFHAIRWRRGGILRIKSITFMHIYNISRIHQSLQKSSIDSDAHTTFRQLIQYECKQIRSQLYTDFSAIHFVRMWLMTANLVVRCQCKHVHIAQCKNQRAQIYYTKFLS